MITFALIGAGAGVFRRHLEALKLLPGRVVALVDINPVVAGKRAQEIGCAFYTDYRAMLREVRPDVAVIMTPPASHASIAIACLQAGCHALVEKPMAIHVGAADEMIAAAVAAGRSLGVIFQQRFRPEVLAARSLLEQGALGQIQHVDMVACCPRPIAYYRATAWRGSWLNEGGGILMNQAPHCLDLLCFLVGMPARVFAWTRRTMHCIEAEDTVQALLEWSNGALGTFSASTTWTRGEVSAPASEQSTLFVTGTAGSLQLSNGQLMWRELDTDMLSFVHGPLQPFPVGRPVSLSLPNSTGDHLAVYRRFCEGITTNARGIISGEEGRLSLEVANSLILSGQTEGPVDLPLNRQQYLLLIRSLQESVPPFFQSQLAVG